ncbi:unnamed protein product [Meganyctiphanes norvegica]|uniref:Uncharacterized protein n=1 Tax=Meganyctiphanes norvegica TaxID=48144 RepID=A0AAV2PV84_MEGNR
MRFLVACTVAYLAISVVSGKGIDCYYCSNYNPDDMWYYDAECNSTSYSRNSLHCDDCDSCYTHVEKDGRVLRWADWHRGAENCSIHDTYTLCYCQGDYCNTNTCEHCLTPSQD